MSDLKCNSCGKFFADFRCSKCKLARYCSRGCQIADWPAHKIVCVDIEKRAENAGPKQILETVANIPRVNQLFSALSTTGTLFYAQVYKRDGGYEIRVTPDPPVPGRALKHHVSFEYQDLSMDITFPAAFAASCSRVLSPVRLHRVINGGPFRIEVGGTSCTIIGDGYMIDI